MAFRLMRINILSHRQSTMVNVSPPIVRTQLKGHALILVRWDISPRWIPLMLALLT